MAAPNNVTGGVGPAAYASPPRRAEPWTADRPGELVGTRQPSGPALGNQGPDQGYMLKLARRFEDELVLTEGEHLEDVVAGCAGVALRRASMFGRAPVVHDLRVAFTVYGFLDAVDPASADWRRALFSGAGHTHHYALTRRIAGLVPDETLRLAPDAVSSSVVEELRARAEDEPGS